MWGRSSRKCSEWEAERACSASNTKQRRVNRKWNEAVSSFPMTYFYKAPPPKGPIPSTNRTAMLEPSVYIHETVRMFFF